MLHTEYKDRIIEVEGRAGSHVSEVVKEALELAGIKGVPVQINFNGVSLTVKGNENAAEAESMIMKIMGQKAEAYHLTDEYKSEQLRIEAERAYHQSIIDRLILKLSKVIDTPPKLIEWLGQFAASGELRTINYDRATLAKWLESAGYAEGDCIHHSDVKKCARVFERWYVGECISHLKRVGAIHPMMAQFAKEYKEYRETHGV